MKLKLFSWNVRGANNPDKRNIIRNFIRSQRVDLVCLLQETKIQEMSAADARSLGLGRLVEWKVVEAEGTAGSILVFWDKRKLEVMEVELGHFSVTCILKIRRTVSNGPSQGFTGRLRGAKRNCYGKN